MRVLTTAHVAAKAGVTHAAIRLEVKRGNLFPLAPGSRPLTFRENEVERWLAERDRRQRPKAEAERIRRAACRFWSAV